MIEQHNSLANSLFKFVIRLSLPKNGPKPTIIRFFDSRFVRRLANHVTLVTVHIILVLPFAFSAYCISSVLVSFCSEISKAQDRLTYSLQDIFTSRPQYRELIRMIMSTVGRGGEGDVGQRIRDEILVIQVNFGTCPVKVSFHFSLVSRD